MVVNRAATETFERNLSVGDTLTVSLEDGTQREVSIVGIVNRTAGELPFGSFAGQSRFYLPTDPFYQQSAESPSEGVDQRAYPQVTVVAAPAQVNEVQNRVRTYLRGPLDASQLVPESVELSAETSGDFVDRIEEIINRIRGSSPGSA